MSFRIATLNLAQSEKRWEERRELIVQQLGKLKPDVFALNEISIKLETGRWLQRVARDKLGIGYALIQQSKAAPRIDAEGIMTRYPVVETANLDYCARDSVAEVARLEIEGRQVDIYVTHLYRSRGEDSLRQYQVQQLLEWIATRQDVNYQIVCGDFNATVDKPSIQLMAAHFQPTQTEPTAFTPLMEPCGTPSHPYWKRFDRCIDFIWVTESVNVLASGLAFNKPDSNDPTLWPTDHVGVWADLELQKG